MAARSLRTMGGGAGTMSFMLCISSETSRNSSAKQAGGKRKYETFHLVLAFEQAWSGSPGYTDRALPREACLLSRSLLRAQRVVDLPTWRSQDPPFGSRVHPQKEFVFHSKRQTL